VWSHITLGSKVIKLDPIHGFTAEASRALGVAGNIATAWVLTLPAAALVAAGAYLAGQAIRSLF
jgi:phosphate/sulfate permease